MDFTRMDYFSFWVSLVYYFSMYLTLYPTITLCLYVSSIWVKSIVIYVRALFPHPLLRRFYIVALLRLLASSLNSNIKIHILRGLCESFLLRFVRELSILFWAELSFSSTLLTFSFSTSFFIFVLLRQKKKCSSWNYKMQDSNKGKIYIAISGDL